jgi:hypothetical protein
MTWVLWTQLLLRVVLVDPHPATWVYTGEPWAYERPFASQDACLAMIERLQESDEAMHAAMPEQRTKYIRWCAPARSEG